MTNYYVFGGPDDRFGNGVRFTSIVKARAYAVRMLEASRDTRYVSIYNRNNPNWIIIPKSAEYGKVGRSGLRSDLFVWYHGGGDNNIDRKGNIKRSVWE